MPDKFSANNLYKIDGLVAVVTGGGSGLGAIMAKTLAANGAARVYVTGRRLDRLQETAKEASGIIVPIQASVTSHDDLQKAVDQITAETGHIDLLINNAGIANDDRSSDARPVPNAQSTAAEVRDYYFNYRPASVWRDCFETNVSAVFTTSMAFLELLVAGNQKRDKSRPTSQIISMGSVAGLTRYTDSYIYNASKAAVHHLSKNLGAAFVPFDVRTNVIVPGLFRTEITGDFVNMLEGHGMPKELIPSQRVGSDEELAGTLLYLTSKAGAYCNGAMIMADGGFMTNHAGS